MKPLSDPYELSQFDPSFSRLVQTFKRVVALFLAMLMLPLAQEQLFAQNEDQQPPSQGYSYNDPYNGQYNSGSQPGYEQQPSYGQQAYPNPAYPNSDQQYSQPDYGQGQPAPQPLSAGQLEQLVAPVALYPDALLAQVLAASTYPNQVAQADQWLRSQSYASPDQIAKGADAQNWDPSVKSLTAFPQVLAEMDQNLQWTTDLGNAYYNQPQDVLETVQIMRRRAQEAGTLQSTPQEAVSYDEGNIELAPPNPEFAYVPSYNPWGVYGAAVTPYPGFSLFGVLGSFLGSSLGPAALRYGVGIGLAAFTHMPWGWLAWGLSWLTHSLLFNHGDYFSASSTVIDRGFAHGGPRARFWHEAGRGYGARGGSYYNTNSPRPYVPRPPMGYTGNRMGENSRSAYSRGYSGRGNPMRADLTRGYATRNVPRPPLEARNRPGAAGGFRSGFVSGSRSNGFRSYNRTSSRPESYASRNQTYRGRSSADYARGQSYRPSSRGYSGDFSRPMGQRYSPAYQGREFARLSQNQSGGSHFFGGGHASKSFHADKHASKGFGGGKHFGGGHTGGGHHSGGHSGGGHHHH